MEDGVKDFTEAKNKIINNHFKLWIQHSHFDWALEWKYWIGNECNPFKHNRHKYKLEIIENRVYLLTPAANITQSTVCSNYSAVQVTLQPTFTPSSSCSCCSWLRYYLLSLIPALLCTGGLAVSLPTNNFSFMRIMGGQSCTTLYHQITIDGNSCLLWTTAVMTELFFFYPLIYVTASEKYIQYESRGKTNITLFSQMKNNITPFLRPAVSVTETVFV